VTVNLAAGPWAVSTSAGKSKTAAPGAHAAFPSLYVNYKTEDCAYQVVITTPNPYGVFGDSGTNDLTACKGFVQFRLTGPGVSVHATLDYGDSTSELYPGTFQPGATYTIQDDNNIAGTRRSITVATASSACAETARPSRR